MGEPSARGPSRLEELEMPEQPAQQQWRACHGEVVRLGETLRRRRRVRAVQRGAATTAGIMCFVVAGYFMFGNQARRDQRFGGIPCRRVMQLADAYLAGDLDAETADKVRQHLDECVACQARLERLMRQTVDHEVGGVREMATQSKAPVADSPDEEHLWVAAAARF